MMICARGPGGPNPPGPLFFIREASKQQFRVHSATSSLETGFGDWVEDPVPDLAVTRLSVFSAHPFRSSSWATFSSSFAPRLQVFSCSSLLLLWIPLSTFSSLNFSSNSSLVFSLRVGFLWKSSHASSFLRRGRCTCSARFLCCDSSHVEFGPRGCVDGACVADRSRAPRREAVVHFERSTVFGLVVPCGGTFVCGPWIWHHCGLGV